MRGGGGRNVGIWEEVVWDQSCVRPFGLLGGHHLQEPYWKLNGSTLWESVEVFVGEGV